MRPIVMSGDQLRILACGDSAVTVEFGKVIDERINGRVLALDRAVTLAAVSGIRETVPTYRSLLVHYDPLVINYTTISERLIALASNLDLANIGSRWWRVPVAYGGDCGIDLDHVARVHNMTTTEVIARHTACNYTVAMIGFTPGFAYLSGLDPSLATPRRDEPRQETPPGTISIGGAQACVQCLASPSGWHLLGRTPVRTFQPKRDPVFLMEPGDRVTFHAIAPKEFEALTRASERGEIVAALVVP